MRGPQEAPHLSELCLLYGLWVPLRTALLPQMPALPTLGLPLYVAPLSNSFDNLAGVFTRVTIAI